MFKVYYASKHDAPVLYRESSSVEEACFVALGIHRDSNVPHLVTVMEDGAIRLNLTLKDAGDSAKTD